MFLNRAIAYYMGRENIGSGMIDEGTDTIIHEAAHLLEELMRRDVKEELWKQGHIAHLSDFTHDAVGTFAEAMKYVAGVWLANYGQDNVEIESYTDKTNLPISPNNHALRSAL